MSAATADGIKNVVLVHGGFVDGSGWLGVYRSLNSKDSTSVWSRTQRHHWPTTSGSPA
jgi:hypothetical protein